MELKRYVAEVERQLGAVAAAGGEQQGVAERLIGTLEAALRLALLDALGAAASEISRELAPGSVEVRLRRGEPEFVVTTPTEVQQDVELAPMAAAAPEGWDVGDGEVTRINLRLPEALKSRVERLADSEGLSTNAWLVRAAAVAAERNSSGPLGPTPQSPRGGQRYTGWAH